MLRHPRPRLLAALSALGAALFVALLSGCSSPAGERLLLAEAIPPDQPQPTGGLTIYGVAPGDELDDSAVLSRRAQGLVGIATDDTNGTQWVNALGREWKGSVLMGLQTGPGQATLTAGAPGADQTLLAEGAQLSTTVLRRGTFIRTPEACYLATSADDEATQVGEGRCSVSPDERWVASWRGDDDGMSVRDLRTGDVTEIDGVTVLNAVMLSFGARVLTIVSEDEGYRGVLFDARSGDEIARTDEFASFAIAPPGPSSTGLVLRAESDDGSQLLYMEADGTTSVIDQGPYLLPLTNHDGKVIYVRYELDDPSASSVRRWSGGEPTTMIEGLIGAGSPDNTTVVVTRETDAGIEFHTQAPSGELQLELELPRQAEAAAPGDGGAGIRINEIRTKGSKVHLVVEEEGVGSYVRLDLGSGSSKVVVRQQPNLRIDSIDRDGTVLLAQVDQISEVDGRTNLLVARPGSDEADRRATVGLTGANLIRNGTIYVTDASDRSSVVVRTLNSVGSNRNLIDLYRGAQIVGATWPEFGGATEAFFITFRALAEQQQI